MSNKEIIEGLIELNKIRELFKDIARNKTITEAVIDIDETLEDCYQEGIKRHSFIDREDFEEGYLYTIAKQIKEDILFLSSTKEAFKVIIEKLKQLENRDMVSYLEYLLQSDVPKLERQAITDVISDIKLLIKGDEEVMEKIAKSEIEKHLKETIEGMSPSEAIDSLQITRENFVETMKIVLPNATEKDIYNTHTVETIDNMIDELVGQTLYEEDVYDFIEGIIKEHGRLYDNSKDNCYFCILEDGSIEIGEEVCDDEEYRGIYGVTYFNRDIVEKYVKMWNNRPKEESCCIAEIYDGEYYVCHNGDGIMLTENINNAHIFCDKEELELVKRELERDFDEKIMDLIKVERTTTII